MSSVPASGPDPTPERTIPMASSTRMASRTDVRDTFSWSAMVRSAAGTCAMRPPCLGSETVVATTTPPRPSPWAARCGGATKTALQHIFTAVALNLARIDAWLTGRLVAKTGTSTFAALQPAVS